MKVLHIIDSEGLYGAEIVLLNLVAEQVKIGLDLTIASIGKKHISEKQIEKEAIKRGFIIAKFRMFPGPNPYGMFKVLRYAQKNKFDILHSHGYKGNVAFGLMPKALRKIPLISTLHGWTSVGGFSKNRVYEWLDLISHKYIDAVVLVNKGMLSNPKLKYLNGENIHIVNNGIPIPDKQFNNSTNQSLDRSIINFCKGGWTVGSIGRLSTEKGYRYLIEALDLLVKKGVDCRLVIIGEGYERKLLEELVVKYKLKNKVLLPGYRDIAKHYLPHFNVFVISSLTEGMPITLLEAMQAKISIVATKVGGIPEVLQKGNAGFLVPPCKPDALAKSISKIYFSKKLATEMTVIAYRMVTTHYSSKAMALGYLNIYNQFIK